MLMEMVVLSLTVLSTLSVSSFQPAPEVVLSSKALVSTVPEQELLAMLSTEEDSGAFAETTLPEKKIVAMFSEPTPTQQPTPTSTPVPTSTPTPTPTNTPPPSPTITPTETPTPTPAPVVASASDIDGYFQRYSSEYSVDKELLRRIAVCESGYNSQARNGNYGGMYQFAEQTWSSVRERMGQDPNPDLRFSAEEAIKTAAYYLANGGKSAWPNC